MTFYIRKNIIWGLGIGDWGLGIGDWGLGVSSGITYRPDRRTKAN